MIKTNTQQTPSLPQMLDEMKIAIDAEIKAQESGDKSHKATDGKLVGEQPGLYLYSFSLEEPWEADDDTPISIEASNGQSIKGTVVTSNGITITISSDKLLSHDTLRKITLIDGFTQSLKQLHEILRNNPEGRAKIGSKSLGLEPHTSKLSHLSPVPNSIKPNRSQSQAIQMSLGSEITYIIGPPGTGKTVTLASIAFNYLVAGQTVLIAAHTNIAVDNAIIQLADICKNSGASNLLQHGKVVRFGASQHADLQKPEYAEISLSAIIKQQEAQLHTQKEQLQQRLKGLEGQLSNLNQNYELNVTNSQAALEKLRSQYNAYNNDLALLVNYQQLFYAVKKELIGLIKNRSSLQNAYAQLNAEYQRITIELAESQSMNPLQRFLKRKRSPDTLASLLLGLEQERFSADQQLQHMKKHIQERNIQLDALKAEIVHFISSKLEEPLPFVAIPKDNVIELSLLINRLQEIVQNMANQIKQSEYQYNQLQLTKVQEQQQYMKEREWINNELENIGIQLKGIEKSVVAKAQIVATTLTKTYMNADLSKRLFDVIIIDEASMAPLPAVYFAASRANQSAVILGDPQQLAPICEAKNPNPKISEGEKSLALKWLGRDIFTLRGITLEKANNGQENCALLKEQSRMHPAISSIAKKYVYNNLIIDASDRIPKEELAQIQPAAGKHLFLCDTSDVSPIAVRPASGSRINIYHAFCSVAIARQVILTLPEDHKQEGKQRVGIVTPYKKQSKLLQNLIIDAGLKEHVRVGTVHKFQGLEFDVVIFDTVESPTIPSIRPRIDFIAGGIDSEALRLINVAVTRAKHKLIVVANEKYIRTAHDKESRALYFPENSILRKAVEEARKAGVINSLDLLGLPSIPSSTALESNSNKQQWENILDQSVFNTELLYEERLNEETFYPRFIQDIQSAKKEIVIVSPYLANRIKELLPLLEAKRKDGVSVIVVINPLNPMYGFENLLKQADIKVLEYSKAHMKHAFIDKEIIYDGSLNILSHKDTHESMIRKKSPRSAKMVWDDLYKEIKKENKEQLEQTIQSKKRPEDQGADLQISIQELSAFQSNCIHCGGEMMPNRNKTTGHPFYGCKNWRNGNHPKYTINVEENHLMCIPSLNTMTCRCNNLMQPKKFGETLWLECAGEPSCGYWRNIIFTR